MRAELKFKKVVSICLHFCFIFYSWKCKKWNKASAKSRAVFSPDRKDLAQNGIYDEYIYEQETNNNKEEIQIITIKKEANIFEEGERQLRE